MPKEILTTLRTSVLALLAGIGTASAQPADLILSHGKIVTVDRDFHIVDALAIRGDRIVGTGTSEALERLAGPHTRRLDLNGKTVLPGLMDSHSHASEASIYEFDHIVPDMETIADVLRYMRSRSAVAKP